MANVLFKNVSFSYQNREAFALSEVTAEIASGQIACIFGKSGSGKSTLLKHLKPKLLPAGRRRGQVLVDGADVSGMSALEQATRVGYVFQDPDAQLVTDKVLAEIAFGLENVCLSPREMRMRISEVAALLGLTEMLDADVNQLSGGQKQLVNLAAVLALRPQVLVLDEPTSALDPIAAGHFHDVIRRLNADTGVTVIVVEQRIDELLPICDVALALDGGQLVAYGAPAEVAAHLCAGEGPTAQVGLPQLLPDVARVYCEVAGETAGEAHDTRGSFADARVPLSAREGKAWLESTFGLAPQKPNSGEGASDRRNPESVAAAPVAPALELDDVWFRYDREGKNVLAGANFAAPKGQITAILGSNGSGKSTLLKCACGVVMPAKGKVLIGGLLQKKHRAASGAQKRSVVMLPQNPSDIMLKETVEQDLADAAVLPGSRLQSAYEPSAVLSDLTSQRISEVAQLTEITHLLKMSPQDLSGGELARCALAKVLMRDADIILLDEPTKGLDNIFKQSMVDLLKKLSCAGKTIVIATHDIEFAARCASQVAFMFDGGAVGPQPTKSMLLENRFYTTQARRISARVFDDVLTNEELVASCLMKVK